MICPPLPCPLSPPLRAGLTSHKFHLKMSNIYCSPVTTQPTPRPRQDCGGFKQLYLLRSASQRERERERDCISWCFQGFDWDGLETRSLTPPILPKVQSTADTSNFDKYPRDEAVPSDELSGWDKEFWAHNSLCSLSRNKVWCPESFSNKMNIFRHFETTAGRNRK